MLKKKGIVICLVAFMLSIIGSSCSPYRTMTSRCPTYDDTKSVSDKLKYAKKHSSKKHPKLNKHTYYYTNKRNK